MYFSGKLSVHVRKSLFKKLFSVGVEKVFKSCQEMRNFHPNLISLEMAF